MHGQEIAFDRDLQEIRLSIDPNAKAYFRFHKSSGLQDRGAVAGLSLSSEDPFQFSDPISAAPQAFYIVESVSLNDPLDSDSDGIDDVFELQLPDILNPLDAADARLDYDEDGEDNLTEYMAGTDLDNPDTTPPVLLEAPTQLLTEETDRIALTFSEAMLASSLSADSFQWIDSNLGEIALSEIIVSGRFIDLVLGEVLTDESSHQLTISGDLRDLPGNRLGAETRIDYQVAVTTRIKTVSPKHGETDVRLTRNVYLDFSHPIDPATITPESLKITAMGQTLPATQRCSDDETRVTLTLIEDLPLATAIRLTIEGDLIQDTEGEAVDADGDGIPGGRATIDFRTSGLTPIPGTAVEGHIFDATRSTDDTKVPIVGLTLRAEGLPEITAITNEEGFFRLEDVPAPDFNVQLDTSTVTSAPEGFAYAGPVEVPANSLFFEDGTPATEIRLFALDETRIPAPPAREHRDRSRVQCRCRRSHPVRRPLTDDLS